MYRRDVSFYATFVLVVLVHLALIAWILFFGLAQCQRPLTASAKSAPARIQEPHLLNLNLADRVTQAAPSTELAQTQPRNVDDDPESRSVLPKAPEPVFEPPPAPKPEPEPAKPEPKVVEAPESKPVPKPKPVPKIAEAPKPQPTPKVEEKPKIAEKPKPEPKKAEPKLVEKPKPKPKPKKVEPKVVEKPTPKPEPKKVEPKLVEKAKPEPKPEVVETPKPAPDPPVSIKAKPTTLPPAQPVVKAKIVPAEPAVVRPRVVDGAGDGNSDSGANLGPAEPNIHSGSGNTSKPAIADMRAYRNSIEQTVTQRLSIPKGLTANIQPEVLVKISRSGKIVYARLSQSSGNSELDKSAIDAVRIGSKLLPLPEGYEKETYEVPIKFQID